MLRFPEKVVLLPGESMTVYAVTPMDVAVLLEMGGEPRLIDVLTPSKFKLAVYGDVSEGVLCRSYDTRIYKGLMGRPGEGEALFRLTMENGTKRAIEVSRMILPAEQMTFYYSDDSAYLEDVRATFHTGVEASIRLLNKPPVEGVKKAPPIFKGEEKEKWVMTFGY